MIINGKKNGVRGYQAPREFLIQSQQHRGEPKLIMMRTTYLHSSIALEHRWCNVGSMWGFFAGAQLNVLMPFWRLKRTFYPVNILSKDANYGDTGSVAFPVNKHDQLS